MSIRLSFRQRMLAPVVVGALAMGLATAIAVALSRDASAELAAAEGVH